MRLQQLIRHFFFEMHKEGAIKDANEMAAKAVVKAREWLANNHGSAPLPSASS